MCTVINGPGVTTQTHLSSLLCCLLWLPHCLQSRETHHLFADMTSAAVSPLQDALDRWNMVNSNVNHATEHNCIYHDFSLGETDEVTATDWRRNYSFQFSQFSLVQVQSVSSLIEISQPQCVAAISPTVRRLMFPSTTTHTATEQTTQVLFEGGNVFLFIYLLCQHYDNSYQWYTCPANSTLNSEKRNSHRPTWRRAGEALLCSHSLEVITYQYIF